LKNDSSITKDDRAALQNEVNRLLNEKDRLDRKIEEEDLRVRDLKTQLNDERDRIKQVTSDLDRARSRTEEAENRLQRAESKCREVENDLQHAQFRLRDFEPMEKKLKHLESDLAEAEDDARKLNKEKRELEQSVTTFQTKATEALQNLDKKEAERKELEHHLDRTDNKLKSMIIELEDITEAKSKIEELLSETKSRFDTEIADTRRSLNVAEQENSSMKLSLASKDEEINSMNVRLLDFERTSAMNAEKLSAAEEDIADKSAKVSCLEDERTELLNEKTKLQSQLQASCNEIGECRATISSQLSAAQVQRAKIQALEDELRAEKEKLAEQTSQKIALESQCTEQERTIREHEGHRRKLHNMVQELKGNIRVYCRVRPALRNGESSEAVLSVPKNKTDVDILHESFEKADPSKRKFQFDHVFSPQSSQQEVFDEVSQVVQSAFDGYRVCLFAYGQTGSGKTHTMLGGDKSDPSQFGVIPRSVQLIFEEADRLKAFDWTFKLTASFLEIYNETIRDLLCSDSEPKQHHIKLVDNKSQEIYVTDLTVEEVKTPDQVKKLIARSMINRATAATNMNERSSRSHSVFSLTIEGRNELSGQNMKGILNLIDLAGSERLNSSGSKGERLRETQHINKSLSALGDVIAALANRDKHVPYRNSKLTHLLQNSLGGDCKTLMFVNLSPTESCFQESLCSLRFASKVNKCDIGTARRSAKISMSDLN